MWRNLRIAVLLLVLLFVALNAYFDRRYATDWDAPLRVTVYPINGDGSPVAERFLGMLNVDHFQPLEDFFEQEARHYGVVMERPIRFVLAPTLRGMPPMRAADAGIVQTVAWSLRTRYWAARVPALPGPAPDIKLFVLYHDPARSASLPHSVGLSKGLIGIVNVFAAHHMLGSNDTIMAHELLHTLGATDKYDLATNQPLFPDGYAEAQRQPRYPQDSAELMGGRIPLSSTHSSIPESLQQVIVGSRTAAEIGWRKS